MAAKKIRDIAVKTGEYQDRTTGETKGRYQNVGALMKNEDGSVFILLARWFSPAGINSDRDTVLLSCFEQREQGETQGGGSNAGRSNAQAGRQQQGGASNNADQDIPF